jgi:hypothetical protein
MSNELKLCRSHRTIKDITKYQTDSQSSAILKSPQKNFYKDFSKILCSNVFDI